MGQGVGLLDDAVTPSRGAHNSPLVLSMQDYVDLQYASRSQPHVGQQLYKPAQFWVSMFVCPGGEWWPGL